jgi:hypothetical protein
VRCQLSAGQGWENDGGLVGSPGENASNATP